MNIKEIKITDIKPYKKNQKKHPDTQINNIATSIDKYGFVQPLVISKDNEIIIGHGRYLAAEKLGIEQIPCVYAENLTAEQIRELRILDNKLNESEWDIDQLKLDLEELDFSEFDLDFDLFENTEEGFIDDLLETEFKEINGEQTVFSISFVFPIEAKEKVDKYISDNGKDRVVDMIIAAASSSEVN